MSIPRITECLAGITTTLIAIVLYSYSVARYVQIHRQNQSIRISFTEYFIVFAVLVVPPLLIGFGSYAQSIKGWLWGFGLVLIGTVVNNLLVVIFFVLIAWGFPPWGVLLFVVEFFLALIALAAAFFNLRKTTSNWSGLARQ